MLTALTFAVIACGAVIVLVVAATAAFDFAARVGRYRRYRRSYPAVDRSRAWRHVR